MAEQYTEKSTRLHFLNIRFTNFANGYKFVQMSEELIMSHNCAIKKRPDVWPFNNNAFKNTHT